MNEYLLYALLGIAAIALVGAFYWLIKVRPIYLALKHSIKEKAERVRVLNAELEQAALLFRLKRVVKNIEYVPPKMASRAAEIETLVAKWIEELSKLTFPSVKDAEWFQEQEELYKPGDVESGIMGLLQAGVDKIYYWLWRGLRPLIVFNRDKVIAALFPRPRGNIATLRQLDESWQMVVDSQQELLELLIKLPGSAEFLDAREKQRVQRKGEKERQEQALASIGVAKERLADAMQYVRQRYSVKSVQVGEVPATAGTQKLTLAMIQEYYDKGIRELAEMEARGVTPAEIVVFITETLVPNLGINFEEKAKEVAKAEFSAGELTGRFNQLSEEAGRKLSVPKPLRKAIKALESEIPALWSQAKWGEFDSLLKAIAGELEKGISFLKEAAEWLDEIDSFKARMAGVIAKQTRLKETYGIEVAASPEWDRIVAKFETEALALWSEVRFDELDVYLKEQENPLRQHQFKISNRLAEADREAGITPPSSEDASDFRTKLDLIASVGDSRPPSAGPRRHEQEPPRRLSGKFVTIRTELGIEMEVDESMAEHYKRLSRKQSPGS